MNPVGWLKDHLHRAKAVPVDLEKLGARYELERMQRELEDMERRRRLQAEVDAITRGRRNHHVN